MFPIGLLYVYKMMNLVLLPKIKFITSTGIGVFYQIHLIFSLPLDDILLWTLQKILDVHDNLEIDIIKYV